MSLPRVTDHALLRYLERARGIDVELIREHIALICAPAANAGAVNLRRDGVQYIFAQGAVVTVLGKRQKPSRPAQVRAQCAAAADEGASA